MQVFYSDHYALPLPADHRFPMSKYRLLRDFLIRERVIDFSELFESPLASAEILELAHTTHYIESMRDGTVSPDIIRRIGFPWSRELYDRSCATVGGALAAMESALQFGISGNLAGGTHHSHADRGEGYCVFNDIAVAARQLKQRDVQHRIAIIDLDVHQGNGNSSILGQDPGVFIFSMHGEKNYPFKKVPSHLDIALPEGADDDLFLRELDRGMQIVSKFKPTYVFYQTGVDPLKEDKLGKMNLSLEGLMERDRQVLKYTHRESVPISLALGGGYAEPIELSVQAYANTYRVAKEIYQANQH